LPYARIALKIGKEAKDAGLQPVAKHLSDYLQMETSFVAGPDGFSTLVRVPLIDMKSALTIWEHHILQIPLEDGLYLNIEPDDYTHLAVTGDHKLYRAMTRAEFNTCRRVGEFYLCNRGLVVTKAPKLDRPPPQWNRPRKHQAPMPPPTAPQPPTYREPQVPPPYAGPGSGRPGYRTSSPAGRPGYSLGASPSLVTDLQANEETTAGHPLGMHHEQAAAMLGFQTGRDQVPVINFPRAAPTAIDMKTMMARQ
jgi:hypothetical protein